MKSEIINENVVFVLVTEDDRAIAAERAPGLANTRRVELPRVMTVPGTFMILKTLMEHRDRPASADSKKAAKIIRKFEAMEKKLKQQKQEAKNA